MSLRDTCRRWWAGRRRRRTARRTLLELFDRHPESLAGTSLRRDHRNRTQVLDILEEPYRIYFGIVRHPRPYRFSRQHHAVLELWCYHVIEGRLERLAGRNLTRDRGEDADVTPLGPSL